MAYPKQMFIDDLRSEAQLNGANADEIAVCERIITDLERDPATLIAEYEQERQQPLSAVNEFSYLLALVYHRARSKGYRGVARKVKRK